MAKVRKTVPSVRSRAAKRATSPSINLDKSLKNAKPPPESTDHRPAILALHQGAGVTKKARKGRVVSSKARRRQERGLDRAEIVMDRTENKIAKSVGRSRLVKGRRATWDDLNHSITIPKANKKKPVRLAEQVEEEEETTEWETLKENITESEESETESAKRMVMPGLRADTADEDGHGDNEDDIL